MSEQVYYEEVPSSKVLIMWIFSKLLVGISIFIFIFGFYGFAYLYTVFHNFFIALICCILIPFSIFTIYLIFLRRTYYYKITDKGVYFTGGIIVKKQKFVPSYKMTNIVTSQNILERVLGISKVGIQTAGMGGSVKPEIMFEGLTNSEKPNELLKKLIERVQRGPNSRSYSE